MHERTVIPEGSSPEEQPETGLDVFVARQPIFSRNLQVYGYELLYREVPTIRLTVLRLILLLRE